MSSCFISDLHLDNKRKDVKKSFFNFLESEASEFDNLYILGDLFEVWIGDDFSDQLTNEVISNLKKYSNKNKKIFIMHGNRDFLLGKEFVQDCGAELISDPLILNYENRRIMLSHGDIFCTDDSEYQKFKEKVRSENWKKEFLSKSLEERKKIAENLRKESSIKNSQKQDFLMDVNKSEIKKIAKKSKIDLLIHGHVHRPKVHKEDFGKRIVLGDWDKKYWYIRLEGEEVSLLSGEIT